MTVILLIFFSYIFSSGSTVSISPTKIYTSPNPKLRIIGGEEAVPHAYPYQAGLYINNNALCGASLISQNYIMTAAHCLTETIRSLDIILGAHNITSNETTQIHTSVANIIIHENYNYTSFQNDIALIKLVSPAPLNDVIKTIALPRRRDATKTYQKRLVTSTGWGLTKDVAFPSLKDISSVLRVVNVTVMDLQECAKDYNDEVYDIAHVTDVNICTSGYENKGTCQGDSGGPLVYRGRQIGIVSIGSTLCEISSPSVFTHVGKFLDWIERNSDVKISQ